MTDDFELELGPVDLLVGNEDDDSDDEAEEEEVGLDDVVEVAEVLLDLDEVEDLEVED